MMSRSSKLASWSAAASSADEEAALVEVAEGRARAGVEEDGATSEFDRVGAPLMLPALACDEVAATVAGVAAPELACLNDFAADFAQVARSLRQLRTSAGKSTTRRKSTLLLRPRINATSCASGKEAAEPAAPPLAAPEEEDGSSDSTSGSKYKMARFE